MREVLKSTVSFRCKVDHRTSVELVASFHISVERLHEVYDGLCQLMELFFEIDFNLSVYEDLLTSTCNVRYYQGTQ